ncbi:MAG: DNA repair exonuclease [Acidobacteria bacterium]|nr:DNA repair exonuclease [Acidobacteriota bacterium]
MFQFIHAADIHLDSPLRGLSSFDDAPVDQIRTATRRAFENLVDLAIRETVAFVLIAGDLWDGTWPDAGPGLFFIRQAKRLREAGIPVYVVKGNHDAENTLTRDLRYPDNVHIFGHLRPETVRIDALGVAIHGQSFREKNITSDLAATYLPAIPSAFNIGLLHTCLDGDARHYSYAPVSAGALAAKGYQYWALGHVHQRRLLEQDGVPIVFPGNLQGRFIPETGPKGCEVVTVDDDFAISSRFEALDVVRWLEESVDLTGANTVDDADRLVSETLNTARVAHPSRLLAVRLHLHGTTGLTGRLPRGEDMRDHFNSIAIDIGDVWLERILVETLPAAAPGEFPLAEEIGEVISEIAGDESLTHQWMRQFDAVSAQLTGELAESDVARVMTDPEAFRVFMRRCGAISLAPEGGER